MATLYAILVLHQKATWNIFPAVHGTCSRGCTTPHSLSNLLHVFAIHMQYMCHADERHRALLHTCEAHPCMLRS